MFQKSWSNPVQTLQQFAETLEAFPSHGDAFRMVDAWTRICEDGIYVDEDELPEDRWRSLENSNLKSERNTWKLLYQLEQDRRALQFSDGEAEETAMAIEEAGALETPRQSANRLIQTDKDLRQALVRFKRSNLQIVTQWLEGIAREEDQEESFVTPAGWTATLEALKNNQAEGLVTSLDPDAPSRSYYKDHPILSLHPEDIEMETRDSLELWRKRRRGEIGALQTHSRSRNDFLRSASIEGGRLFDFPALIGEDGSLEGNVYRSSWKRAARALAQAEKMNEFERALYGSFSGYLQPMLSVSRTWEDFLWCYFTTLVDNRIDDHLQRTIDNPLLLEKGNEDKLEISQEGIFKQLRSKSLRALNRFHVIQEYLILGEIDHLFLEMRKWINEKIQPHLLRLAAHLVIFYLGDSLVTQEMTDDRSQLVSLACQEILSAYIRQLIESRQISFIALYTSYLPVDLQVSTYAQFLADITEKDEQETSLMLAEKAGLDVASVTKYVVELIRDRSPKDLSQLISTGSQISPVDERKIRAVEWLTFDSSHRPEALRQGNALTRSFLDAGKMEAAFKLFEEVLPADSADLVAPFHEDAIIRNVLKEYLCYREYLQAHRRYQQWHSHHVSKPSHPPSLSRLSNSFVHISDSTYSRELSFKIRSKEYNDKIDAWKVKEDQLSLQARETIMGVISFPGGWLKDDLPMYFETSEPGLSVESLTKDYVQQLEKDRGQQLEKLRKDCIPTLFFMMQNVLNETNQFRESVGLADLLADEFTKFYKLFSTEELRQFLKLVRTATLHILETSPDPLGYK